MSQQCQFHVFHLGMPTPTASALALVLSIFREHHTHHGTSIIRTNVGLVTASKAETKDQLQCVG